MMKKQPETLNEAVDNLASALRELTAPVFVPIVDFLLRYVKLPPNMPQINPWPIILWMNFAYGFVLLVASWRDMSSREHVGYAALLAVYGYVIYWIYRKK